MTSCNYTITLLLTLRGLYLYLYNSDIVVADPAGPGAGLRLVLSAQPSYSHGQVKDTPMFYMAIYCWDFM